MNRAPSREAILSPKAHDSDQRTDVQAEPEDAHNPFMSSKSSIDSPSMPSKQKFTFPKRAFVLCPFNMLCGIFDSSSISLSRIFITFFSLSAFFQPTL
jgi:hypothetical protein